MNANNSFPIRSIRLLRSLCRALILMIFISKMVLSGAVLPTAVIASSLPSIQLSGTLFVKPGGIASGQCASWETACDLQYALTNTVPPAELWVKMGSYTPTNDTNRNVSFQLKSGVVLYGGFIGDETDHNQRNPAANPVILSGEIGLPTYADNSFHVVNGTGTDSSAVLDGFTISGGHAIGPGPDRSGGGMVINSGSPTLRNVTFIGNTSYSNGGGLYISSSNSMLTNVSFINNSVTTHGGGLYCQMSSPVFVNITFSGNSSDSYGGGLASYTCNLSLNNVTFSGNTANQGGGIYNQESSSLVMRNSILSGNTLDQIYNDSTSSSTLSYSDVEGGYVGEGNLDASPVLGVLGNYGGSTQVFPLLPGSSAIDAGDDTSCAATDQRGITRPQLAHCDMGAYESRGFNLAISSGENQSAAVNIAFAQPLVVSVTSTFNEPVNGGYVTFTPPATGASAVLSVNPAIITGGFAQVAPTANAATGPYQVHAGAAGALDVVNFELTNLPVQGVFSKSSPINGALNQPINLTLSWESSAGAVSYEYCIDTTDINPCDGDAWHSAGTNLSAELSSLQFNTLYYWQVRAVAGSLVIPADAGVWWHFRTMNSNLLFLPVARR